MTVRELLEAATSNTEFEIWWPDGFGTACGMKWDFLSLEDPVLDQEVMEFNPVALTCDSAIVFVRVM